MRRFEALALLQTISKSIYSVTVFLFREKQTDVKNKGGDALMWGKLRIFVIANLAAIICLAVHAVMIVPATINLHPYDPLGWGNRYN